MHLNGSSEVCLKSATYVKHWRFTRKIDDRILRLSNKSVGELISNHSRGID